MDSRGRYSQNILSRGERLNRPTLIYLIIHISWNLPWVIVEDNGLLLKKEIVTELLVVPIPFSSFLWDGPVGRIVILGEMLWR